MLQLPDLENLISDACIFGCQHILRQVFLHLKARGFRINEIVAAVGNLLEEENLIAAARTVEDVAASLRPNLYPNQQNDDSENII